jgi:cation diffusion facilitator CzcD-associated flavoprotein CzcO
MSRPDSASAPFDPEAVHAKYLAERDKRLVEGRADIRDLDHDDVFGHYRDDPFTPFVERAPVSDEEDVVILGGGIAGVLVGAELRKRGVERIRLVDQAGGIGGTWYWNRYPGVMCDVESYIYMPMLEEFGYIPKDRYASGNEIRGHLERIAERYRLMDEALWHTDVTRAEWHDDEGRWHVHTDRGDDIACRWYVLGAGILNLMKLPCIPGMEDFAGHSFHTARWDYDYTGGRSDYDYTGDGTDELLDKLEDKTIALLGTGASGIQALPPLARSAKHVYVFQRTPSAIGVRDNHPTDEAFGEDLEPGWQKRRMDNFQAVMLGRTVDRDAVDDGWTHHYAVVNNPPYVEGMTRQEFMQNAEALDYGIMEEHRQRVDEVVADHAVAECLKPYYRYICKRPCFHDEYLGAFNSPNVTLIDCPAGIDKITAEGPVVDGKRYDVNCLVYGTGFEAERTPLSRRVGHEIVGRHGVTLEEQWADGPVTLFGILSRDFPNMFALPAPSQQSVVTVNYTQLAVLGAEFVGTTIGLLRDAGIDVFDVSAEAQESWVQEIVGTYTDISRVMSACTPSRINNEGHPETISPKAGNYGGGFGDWFAYRDIVEKWLADGRFNGLELDLLSPSATPTTP